MFAPNVRGSSGFGKRFVNLDNGAGRFDAICDIEACVGYVVEAGVADPRRIGIMGGSYGGYMTMAGLSEYPELFAAGANLYGVVIAILPKSGEGVRRDRVPRLAGARPEQKP